MALKDLQKTDPVKRMAKKETGQPEYSPMDPPDAYNPPVFDVVPYEELHFFLQKLTNEHKTCAKELDIFEQALMHIQEKGIDKEVDGKMRKFFEFFDNAILTHIQEEEKAFFPMLQKRLLEDGEHSRNNGHKTAVDLMRNDHLKALQLASVSFNLLALAVRLPDAGSRIVTLNAALEQAKSLVELLKLHIFREDNIIFPLSHKYLTQTELDELCE